MNKPISILINEAKINITKVINASSLPPCLIQPIIKDIYEQVLQQCQQELQDDMAKYESEEKEKDNDSEK